MVVSEIWSEFVADICGENWDSDVISLEERDGAYAVAMVYACVFYNIRLSLIDMSNFLMQPVAVLENAYRRLQNNEVLSFRSPILKDPLLRVKRTGQGYDEDMDVRRAWCHIAALGSGFVGKGRSN